MKCREVWGIALILVAVLCAWANHVLSEAYWAAAREGLLLYVGIPVDSIASWFLVVALLSGAVGLLLLLPALIGRTPGKCHGASLAGPRAWLPRVKDQDCQLEITGSELQLICGAKRLDIRQ